MSENPSDMPTTETDDVHNWDVYAKGQSGTAAILGARPPHVSLDGELVSFYDAERQLMALYPTNAIAGIARHTRPNSVGTYPIEQTPNGSWLRNTKTDGTGHWVPYTGPLFGIKE